MEAILRRHVQNCKAAPLVAVLPTGTPFGRAEAYRVTTANAIVDPKYKGDGYTYHLLAGKSILRIVYSNDQATTNTTTVSRIYIEDDGRITFAVDIGASNYTFSLTEPFYFVILEV